MIIRPATTADFPAILALNEASVHFLAPMDHSRLLGLSAGSSYHRVVEHEGQVLAFLLVFRGCCRTTCRTMCAGTSRR